MSGSSMSSESSSSCWCGAPSAAEGGLLRAIGQGVSRGKTLLEIILGGLSGLGAAAGVLGVLLRKVTVSGVLEPLGVVKVPTVVMAGESRRSLILKSSRQEIASMSFPAST